jgi:hypothetical protein
MFATKRRLYNEDHMKFGFTITERNWFSASCHAVLSNDAMRPGRLEGQLNTNHKKLKDKPKNLLVQNFEA